MKKLSILILTITLFACYSNSNFDRNSVFKKEYIPLLIPNWLLNIPKGDFEIGISFKYASQKEELEHAKEFATVNINRNQNSVVIYKSAKIENEEKTDFANFKINVSKTISKIDSIYKSLTIVDTTYLGNYLIALMSYNGQNTNIETSKIKKLTVPKWYNENRLFFDNNYVYASVKYSSANLINALKVAMEKARYKLARYKSQHVSVISTTTYTKSKKAYSLETETTLGNLKTVNIYILKKVSDNSLFSYEVYLRMRGEK